MGVHSVPVIRKDGTPDRWGVTFLVSNRDAAIKAAQWLEKNGIYPVGIAPVTGDTGAIPIITTIDV